MLKFIHQAGRRRSCLDAGGAGMRKVLLLMACFLAAPVFADDTLWGMLQSQPNMIVLTRHAYSTGGNPLAWDETGECRGERLLSPGGKLLARKIGEAFKARGIKPSVISSPMCRCRETAEIAFGKYVTDPALREMASADTQRQQAFESKAKELIAGNRGNAPVVFVSHRPNIDLLTLELIDEGELLVGRVGERGEIEALGKIRIEP